MKTVAVFFGGQSVEHEISIITGVMTANSLDKNKYKVLPVYVSTDGKWYSGERLLDLDGYKSFDFKKLDNVTLICGGNALYSIKKNKLKKIADVAVAINCMHGERGEDGSLAGLLNMCKIALASPPMMPSSISIDKAFTKTVLKSLKIKTLSGVTVSALDELEQLSTFKFPVIVKPNRLGSSIGVSKVDEQDGLSGAVSYALKFGNKALIEPCLENFIEINCAAYESGDKGIIVSKCERPVGKEEVLSFGDKYESGKRVFPADIDKKYSDKIKNATEKIYRELGFKGVIRIDYFISGGEVYLNEINTVPGSLAYYLFSDTLKGFTAMLNQLIEVAERDFAKESTTQKTFKSGILTRAGSKGSKRL
ncbi:MAG: ATP-grasp domain-containing protein [Clostridia bacterium]|nr:ATP-grasp domain-containing protein [Clostridia bacterium]